MKNSYRFLVSLFILVFITQMRMISYAQVKAGSFIFEVHLRNYLVFLPQSYNGVDKLPLIFNLHGYSLDAQQQMNYSKMNTVADTAGFIVVYPNAVETAWNAGIDATAGHVNDVGFINALIDTLINNYSIDEKRIYSCGFSLGGFMSHRLACELSNRIAAIGDVAGTMANSLLNNFETSHSMPVIKIHGTSDGIVYYNGVSDWSTVEQTVQHWTNFNQCISSDTISIPNIDTLDGCSVQKVRYKNLSDSVEVIFYKILKGGHSWPGGDKSYLTSLSLGPVGNTNMDINASELIWNFFKKYTNPLVSLAYCKRISFYPSNFIGDDDTLTIFAQLYNPEGHASNVLAYIVADNSDYKDSLELQVSNSPIENLWQGKKFISNLEKDFYKVIIKTKDLDKNLSNVSPYYGYFTNIGPLVADDTIVFGYYDEWSYLQSFKFILKNTDTTTTVSDVNVWISTDDKRINKMGNNYSEFYDLPAGGTTTSKQNFSFSFFNDTIKSSINKENPIKIKLDIYSKNRLLWIDTLDFYYSELVDVEKSNNLINTFNLSDNFPNPFNPTTTINYSIPKKSNVVIKVYDILGNEIEALVNEEKSTGNYEVEFDGSKLSSGVYFYQLKAGEYIETKKMILLR